MDGEPAAGAKPRVIEIADPSDSLYAPASGLFDRAICAGQDVAGGDLAGQFHYLAEPERQSIPLRVPHSGLVLAHGNRGMVSRGELLALILREVAGS